MTKTAHQSFYVRCGCFPTSLVSLAKADIFSDLVDAYKGIQAALVKRKVTIAAWKLGGTNPTTQKTFSVKEPYFGAIAMQQLFKEQIPAETPARLLQIQAEPELMLRLATDLRGPIHEQPKGSLFDRWCWGLEFPNSPIPEIPKLGVCALIADQCAAGLLVLGSSHHMDTLPLTAEILVYHGDNVVAKGSLTELTAPPVEQAKRFVDMSAKIGVPIKAGQWIATGGLAPCVTFKPETPIRLSVDGDTILDIKVPEKVLIHG